MKNIEITKQSETQIKTQGNYGWRKRINRIRRTLKILVYILLCIGSLIFIFPLVWLISTSFKPDTEIFKVPPQLLPNPFYWLNYPLMFKYFPFMQFFKNTVIITALNVAGVVITAPIVAYAFARLKWPGRDILFMLLLGTLMIPHQVTMIPLYILFSKIHWVDTFLPLWIPSWFGGGAFYVFLIRQFLMTIPKEMEESAVIDGATHFQIYRSIMLPLIQPVLATVAIFQFMNSWNDFMGPLIYINDQTKFTLSLGLRLFQQQTASSQSQYGMMMAATVLMIVPVIVFFFIGQKRFIEGVVLSGMKA